MAGQGKRKSPSPKVSGSKYKVGSEGYYSFLGESRSASYRSGNNEGACLPPDNMNVALEEVRSRTAMGACS